jgi:hypothetical protein
MKRLLVIVALLVSCAAPMRPMRAVPLGEPRFRMWCDFGSGQQPNGALLPTFEQCEAMRFDVGRYERRDCAHGNGWACQVLAAPCSCEAE